ncbi:MAG: hypothetical protein PHE55_09570 [Methylococcaceae bacterium]|nr:hypothetical protein [Methylococcaceae bacterium]
MAVLLVGCTIASKPPEGVALARYHRDAQTCRGQTAITPKVRTNVANVTELELDAGHDPVGYLICMEKLGWKPDSGAESLLAAQKACHERTSRAPTVTRKGTDTRLAGHHDDANFADCMRAKGFEGEVIIGPFQAIEPVEK